MPTTMRTRRFRSLPALAAGLAALALGAGVASAQTYGFATMQPGTLEPHQLGSAIAKVLKEKGGLNVLVQPTAGEIDADPDGRARRSRPRHRQYSRSRSRQERPAPICA